MVVFLCATLPASMVALMVNGLCGFLASLGLPSRKIILLSL